MSKYDRKVAELLAKPSLAGLAYALRHPEVWPEDYAKAGWHFDHCFRCAMGLAHFLWPDQVKTPTAPYMTLAMGEPYIFIADLCVLGRWGQEPTKIADAIDAYLAEREHA